MIGTRLGPYEITAKLGEGGMGQVFQAKDSHLGRNVALKVLPEGFTSDPERLARFEREAKLLAQLNHPNIAQIYGFEASGETRALVMELVEGPTLAERLEQGPLPFKEGLSVSVQIAHALEEAHEKGIIHRDLKPQNIKASLAGKVKVLDFGLAKAMDPAGSSSPLPTDLAHSPTLTFGGTREGVILGTAAYMSPEQARGGAVDKRADVWAFGVVLYEMLAGERLFAAATVPDTLAAVLTREVDWERLPPSVPPAIRRLLRRCLERDPKNRLHDIADARIVLDEVLSGRAEGGDAERRREPGGAFGPRRRAALGAVSLAAAGIAGYLIGARPRGSEPSLHVDLVLGAGDAVAAGRMTTMTFAPDGHSLVVPVEREGRQFLVRRFFGERRGRPVQGTEGGESPFFSPDGRWLGFVADGAVMKVPAEGGRPFPVGGALGAGGAAWLPDDTIVFAPSYSEGLFRVAAGGGEPERLTTPDRAAGELGHWWPEPLPGGRHLVFTAFRSPADESRIGTLDLATRELRWVVEGGLYGRWAPSGHLLYARGRRLFALPFDADALAAKGPAVEVLDDVYVSQLAGFASFAVSSRSALAYLTDALGHPERELIWLDRAGRARPAVPERRRFHSVALAPDGSAAALSVRAESLDLWIYSFARSTLSRLTSGPATETDPFYTRDGTELVYVVDRPPFQLHRIRVGAPDTGAPIWDELPEVDNHIAALAPDGQTLAFVRTEGERFGNIYVRRLDESAPARPFRATAAHEIHPTFSPDGRWLAYASTETGRFEIYVEAFPGPGERHQVTNDGGQEPKWIANGEIFYRRGGEFRVVATRLGQRLDLAAPRTLFDYETVSSGLEEARSYDVLPDGSQILALRVPESAEPRHVPLITDWRRSIAAATNAER